MLLTVSGNECILKLLFSIKCNRRDKMLKRLLGIAPLRPVCSCTVERYSCEGGREVYRYYDCTVNELCETIRTKYPC